MSGRFRQDLYFRLNVVGIKLPPLRERRMDIPLLAAKFLEKYSDAKGLSYSISDDGLRRLVAYDWPGNVRELEHGIERAIALSSDHVLDADDFPFNPKDASLVPFVGADEFVPLEELERSAILRAMEETGGDKIAAARILGIGKTTLYRKLFQYYKSRS